MPTRFVTLFSALIFSSSGLAVKDDSSAILTWQELVERTQKENTELQSADSTLRASQMNEKAANSGYFPQITGSLGYSQGNSSSSTVSTDTLRTYSTSLTATQNIFSGFQDQAKAEQASANTNLSRATLMVTKAKISYDLKSAYAALLFSQDNLELQKDILRRREANLKLVDLRFYSGRENKGSVLLSKAYLEQSKYELNQAINSISTAQVQIAKLISYSQPQNLRVRADFPTKETEKTPDLVVLSQSTPEVLLAKYQEESSRANLKLSDSAFYPTLNLSGTTGNSGQDWYPETNRWSVGATLSFPLFSGGKDYYGRKGAQETWRASSTNLQTQRQASLLKLQQTYAAFSESLQKISVDQAFLEALLVQERIAKEKYNNGLLSFEEWDKIENDLISRQKVILQTRKDRIVNEAAWEQAQGKGVFQ